MKRGKLFLEDSDWKQANEYFDKVLDIDPEYAPAYVGKLCAELEVRQEELLGDYKEPISEQNNFQKAMRFGNADFNTKLKSYDEKIRERLRQEHYNGLVQAKNKASTEKEFQELVGQFKSMNGYKKSSELSIECGKQYQRLKESREERERQKREQERIEHEQRTAEEKREKEEQKRQEFEGKRRAIKMLLVTIVVIAIAIVIKKISQ
jgi:hypothetical protein